MLDDIQQKDLNQLFTEYQHTLRKGECIAYLLTIMFEDTWEEFLKTSLYYKGNLHDKKPAMNDI